MSGSISDVTDRVSRKAAWHVDVTMAVHLRADHGYSWAAIRKRMGPFQRGNWSWFKDAVEAQL